MSSADRDYFLARAEAVLDKRGRALVRLFGREAWDLFVAVFTETDRLQHRYWDVLDPRLAGGIAPERLRVRDRVIALYERLDGYVAELVALAGDGCRIVLVSDHGFGPAAFRRINMQRLAGEIGLGGAMTATSALGRFGITKRRVYKYAGWLVPEGRLRNAERLARDRALRDVKGKLVKLHDYIGGVWIHRASRGGPLPDGDVAAFRDRIVERLLAIEHEGTGTRLVTRAVAREELFEGERVAAAPDVVFFVDDRYGLDPTPREPALVYRAEPPNTGTHRSDGIFLIAGPDVVPGVPLRPLRIEDAAPTILHLLGLPVPAAMDGRVIAEALATDRPVTISYETYGAGGVGRWDSEDEEEEIMERLRGIGYVE